MLKPNSCGEEIPISCNIKYTWNVYENNAYESTHEIYKQSVQASLDGWGVAKRDQVHLWHKTGQNLTDIDTCENIRLTQACIYHDYYKIFSKGQEIMAIHHNLPL